VTDPVGPDLSGLFTPHDVRGVAGRDLTTDVVRALGAGFAGLLAEREAGDTVILAHDMRVSSPALADAAREGLVLGGAQVLDAGLSATDQLYCASGLRGVAGLMITASHNPARDNGLKFCLPGARPIDRATGLDRVRILAQRLLATGGTDVPAGTSGSAGDPAGTPVPIDTLDEYLDTVLTLAPPPDRPVRIVVDAGNAMAGLTVPALAARVPSIDLIGLHMELDGTFPHHPPNPIVPENLLDLQERVVSTHADLGLAFDGDADRCVVVDETGRPVPPSAVTALIATAEIARARAEGEQHPVVVANLVSSRHVREAIAQAGGIPVRAKVGHAGIKRLMAEKQAVFGGEHSAHYYFRDFFFADSGLLAALHVIGALGTTDGTLSQLVAAHDPYPGSGEINRSVDDPAAAIGRVRAWADAHTGRADGTTRSGGVEADCLDGLTLTHWSEGPAPSPGGDWWLSLRPSNTEALLRLNVEARDPQTLERVRDEVLGVIG
jgi:phosphomannomutase